MYEGGERSRLLTPALGETMFLAPPPLLESEVVLLEYTPESKES
jgi:hypothetical protein